ncbi:MAG: enoyl-CoA hydratase/isomerase family protein [Saprospiraceae bacterium]|nr:enoyl-CoA hydratase/isomerase family protein [Saprospiraceae bacterium]
MSQDNGHVNLEIDGHLATITFYHPSHNALPGHLLADLAKLISQAGDNDQVHLILVKSGGDRTFCAGASFDELVSIEDYPTGKEFFMGFARVINALRSCRKITLGRIQGKAVGGGVGICSAVDYAIATKYASVRLSELAVGIGPFVVGPAVERKIGLSAFSNMTLNPTEWKTAEWAKENNLFAEAFDTTEQMDDYIQHFAEKLLSYNPEALAHLKRVFWDGTSHWDDLLEERAEISGNLILSPFAKNAINKFKQKK